MTAVIATLAFSMTARAADEPNRTITLDLGSDMIPAVEGHTEELCAVTYSPDGKMLATAGRDLAIRVWNDATRECKLVLNGHTAGKGFPGVHWDWNPGGYPTLFGRKYPDVPPVAGVWSLSFHPNGGVLASAGADGTVRLWDVKSGAAIRSMTGHTGDVRAVAYSPDGITLASAGRDGTVRVWDPATGQATAVLTAIHGPVAAVAFSPDGKRIASGCWEGAVDLWEPSSGQHIATLDGLDRVQTLTFSPDGKMLAAGGEWQVSIRRWNVANRERLESIRGNDRGVRALAYSPDGSILAAANMSGSIKLWSPSGECLQSFDGRARSICFRPDGKRLVVADREVEFRDLSDTKSARRLPSYRPPVNRRAATCIGLRSDAKVAATGDILGAVRLWDTNTGKCTAELGRHDAPVVAVRFSPDGKVLVSVDADEGVRTWDAAAGKVLTTLREPRAAARERREAELRALNEKDRLLPGFLYDSNLGYRDIRQFQVDRRLVVGPAGNPVAACDGKAVHVWDASGKLFRTLDLPGNIVEIAGSLDGKTLAVLCESKSTDSADLVTYDLITGAPMVPRGKVSDSTNWSRMVVSPDGTDLVISKSNGILMVPLKGKGRRGSFYQTSSDWVGMVTNVTISQDGKWLAGVGWGGLGEGAVIAVRDLKNHKTRAVWRSSKESAVSIFGQVAFLDDGTGVVTASSVDGRLRTWKWPAQK
jgi:WD40 repeat protein